MSKSTTCAVLVRLAHGIIMGEESFGIAMDSYTPRLALQHGLNENLDRVRVEHWLKKNAHLSCVRNGLIQIVDNDRLARDSSRK